MDNKNAQQVKTKKPKNTKRNIIIIAGFLVVVIAAAVFAMSLMAQDENDDSQSGGSQGGSSLRDGHATYYKPIIYLYPESELALNVQLGRPEVLTATYPKYKLSGWNVLAYPNGDLIDQDTQNKLYALYWEGEDEVENVDYSTGFMVKGEDSAEFLEKKLKVLGLNYKEAEEFIIYWLPKLEVNKYNFIYFKSAEEIEQEMPIAVSVEPDTVIRVRMVFKGLDESIEVNEQVLEKAPARKGFTMVEWGGTEIKS